MYKVFFKDRTVYFGDDFSKAFEKNNGLFYRFTNSSELKALVNRFFSMDQVKNLHIFYEDIRLLQKEFKACFTFIEAGGGVVLNSLGEFLVIQRNGIWYLPKGKLEKGEDFETAALREVEEETGLKGLKLIQPLISTYHTYIMADQKILKQTLWYEMRYSGTENPSLQATEGITDSRWVKAGAVDFIRKNTYQNILDVLFIRGLL